MAELNLEGFPGKKSHLEKKKIPSGIFLPGKPTNYSCHWPMDAHHPLCSVHLYQSNSCAKVEGDASGEGKPSDRNVENC